jgi:hypothetical protein
VTSDGQSDAGLRRLYRGRLRGEWPAVDAAMLATVDARAEIAGVTRTDPDDTRVPFALEISFRIPAYARTLDDGSLLLTPLAARRPVGQAMHAEELALATKPAERRYPVRIGCSKLVTLTERMALPPGATVKGLPDPVKLDGVGRLAASWRLTGGELVIEETLALSKRIFAPEEWPALRAALESFRTLSETQIVVAPARRGKERA